MAESEPVRVIASVLVIAADSSIEALLGELIAFAGYRPLFDATTGAAGESIRRRRPDVTLLDIALSPAVFGACVSAADEVGCEVVLVSSSASSSELEAAARAQDRAFFALPGGPQPLARVLDGAVKRQNRRPVVQLALPHSRGAGSGSLHPSFCAAIASVANNRSRAPLRAAVADYTRHLKQANVPITEALGLVHDVIRDCAGIVGAEAKVPALLRDSDSWAQQVYSAA